MSRWPLRPAWPWTARSRLIWSSWAIRSSCAALVAILVDNAVKYAGPRGSASLILRPQGDEAVLSVHNTGEPIPPEHLPRLFERFYRTDSDRPGARGATVWGCPSPRAS